MINNSRRRKNWFFDGEGNLPWRSHILRIRKLIPLGLIILSYNIEFLFNRFRDWEARKFTTPHSTLLVSIRGSHIPDCPFPKEYLEIGRCKLLKASCRSFKSRFIPSQSEMIMLWVEGEWLLTTPDAINIKRHQSLLVWGRPTQPHLWHGTCHGIPCSSRGFHFLKNIRERENLREYRFPWRVEIATEISESGPNASIWAISQYHFFPVSVKESWVTSERRSWKNRRPAITCHLFFPSEIPSCLLPWSGYGRGAPCA